MTLAEKINKFGLENTYLTEDEVADMLDITLSRLRRYRYTMRGLPYVRTGGSVRYKWVDIKDFLDRNRVESKVSA